MSMGNTFDKKTYGYGHAKKVWREVRHRYPGGGTVTNVSDWASVGKIPAGTPIKFDQETHKITAVTDASIKGASDVTTLGINAFLQEDIVVSSASTVASGTAVYAGELYEYMFDSAVVTKLKTLTTVPQIVWVQ